MLPQGGRDVKREVLLNINDEKSFLSACTVDKSTYSLCDNTFFRNRLNKKYPMALNLKPESLSWKEYYLQTVYYMDLMREMGFNWTGTVVNASAKQYYHILKIKSTEVQIERAAEAGYSDVAIFLLEELKRDNTLQETYLINAFHLAILSKSKILIDYFINNNLIVLNVTDFYYAVRSGNDELIDYIFEILSRDETIYTQLLNEGLLGAAYSGNKRLFSKYLNLGANDYDEALLNASKNDKNVHIIDWFNYVLKIAEKHVEVNMYGIVRYAAESDNNVLVKYLIEKYDIKDVVLFNNIVLAVLGVYSNKGTIIPYLLSLGANQYNRFYLKSVQHNKREWMEYFKHLIPNMDVF